MGVFYLSVLMVLTVVCVTTVRSESCCLPKQWEGVETDIDGLVYPNPQKKPRLTESTTEIVYDGKNNQLATTANTTVGNKTTLIRTVTFFTKGLEYSIDLKWKQCRKAKIMGDMPDECLPDQMNYLGSSVFGGGPKSLQCETYSMTESAYGVTIDSTLVITRGGDGYCYPVGETLVGMLVKDPMLYAVRYMNITEGISDPSVFQLPAYCNRVPTIGMVRTGYGFLGLHRP